MAKHHITSQFCPVPLEERFWLHVNKTETCWLWTGARQRDYGKVRVYLGHRKYADRRAHRVAWELTNGPITDPDLCVCHKCDVRLCVRPDHLFLGTRAENLSDMTAKGRRARGAQSGQSAITPDIVRLIRSGSLRRGELSRLARELGVTSSALSLIRLGKNWKSVT